MAKGWVNDDACSGQIEDSINDEICRARRLLPSGPGLETCQECEAPIPLARRHALPGVRLCVSCQQQQDKTSRTRQFI